MKRVFSILTASLLCSMGIILGSVTAASAHDAIDNTYPIAGKTVSAGAFDVTVNFNDKILNVENNAGLRIVVSGPVGDSPKRQSPACIHRTAKSMSVPVDLDKNGIYKVKWRSVSSDGHPIDGGFSFRVKNSNGYVSAGVPEASNRCLANEANAAKPSPTSTASAGATAEPTETTPAASPNSTEAALAGKTSFNGDIIGLLIAIGFVIAGSVLGAIKVDRHNKKLGKQTDRRYE